jgi:chromosome partitioning protein
MKTIVIANQKGGVGKSTTTINLGAALVNKGKRILLIDADHQGHTTKGLGIDIEIEDKTLADVLISDELPVFISQVMKASEKKGLWVVPSDIRLAMVEMKLSLVGAKEYRLRKKIETMIKDADKANQFDYCLIDCPPTFGNICINAFLAADWVIMPIQMGYFSFEGVDSFMESLDYVNNELGDLVNHNIDFLGVLINFYDRRNNLSLQMEELSKGLFKDLLFDTRIPVNIKLNEAQSKGVSIFDYDQECKGALAYDAFAEEVLKRLEEKTKNEFNT